MPQSPSLKKSPMVSDWLRIGDDGTVYVTIGKVEIGQRITTAARRIVAEELGLDVSSIVIDETATGISPDEGMTSGSNSVQHSGLALRAAAATAHAVLLERASQHLKCSAADLKLHDGVVRTIDRNAHIGIGDLVTDGFDVLVDKEAKTRPATERTIVGRPATAEHLAEIVTGELQYIHDIADADTWHARVVRPPHAAARLIGIDPEILAPTIDAGVDVLIDGSFVAVIAKEEWHVLKAMTRLAGAAEWDDCGGIVVADVYDGLRDADTISLPVVADTPIDGDVPAPLEAQGDGIKFAATYERPYVMHGSIGPSAAAALFEDGALKVWTHSQGIYPLRGSIAESLDMEEQLVTIVHIQGAGCYGHNGADDAAFEAAVLAVAYPGRKVLLKWTRDDEHSWEPFGTAMCVDVSASVSADGALRQWSQESRGGTFRGRPRSDALSNGPKRLLANTFRNATFGEYEPTPNMDTSGGLHRNQRPLYDAPETRFVKHLVKRTPVRTSALRCLGATANVFAIESAMDEMAEMLGQNPIMFRQNNLSDVRAKEVLSALADRFDLSKSNDGYGRGIAFARYKNAMAYTAVGVEVRVDDEAQVHLSRAVIVADAGEVIDPDGTSAQLEGGFMQAASWCLYEQVGFNSGGVTTRDWESYPILRFDNVPAIEVQLIDKPEETPLGVGEASGGPTVAAIANAIYRAIGVRMYRMPFTSDAIMRAAAGD